MKSLPDRLSRRKKNRFHYSLYCPVGFVLVSVKDVMKLLDDNQCETKSATTAVGTRAISAHLATGTNTHNVPLAFSVDAPCWLKQHFLTLLEINYLVIVLDYCGLAELVSSPINELPP